MVLARNTAPTDLQQPIHFSMQATHGHEMASGVCRQSCSRLYALRSLPCPQASSLDLGLSYSRLAGAQPRMTW